jgi:hypothetical protein
LCCGIQGPDAFSRALGFLNSGDWRRDCDVLHSIGGGALRSGADSNVVKNDFRVWCRKDECLYSYDHACDNFHQGYIGVTGILFAIGVVVNAVIIHFHSIGITSSTCHSWSRNLILLIYMRSMVEFCAQISMLCRHHQRRVTRRVMFTSRARDWTTLIKKNDLEVLESKFYMS